MTQPVKQRGDFGILHAGDPAEPQRAALRSVARPSLLIFDLLALGLALAVASLEPGDFEGDAGILAVRISVGNLLLVGMCWTSWSLLLWIGGLYQAYRSNSFSHYVARLCVVVSACSGVALVALLARGSGNLTLALGVFWGLSILLVAAVRSLAYVFDTTIRPRFRQCRTAVVVGTGKRAEQLLRELPTNRQYAYTVLGLIDSEPKPQRPNSGPPVLGGVDVLRELLLREPIDDVLITLPIRSHYEEIARVVALCEDSGVQSQYLADIFETSVTKRLHASGEDNSRVTMEMVHNDYRLWIKRAFDLFVASLLLVITAPLLSLIALAVRLSSPGPAIFTQTRIGLNRRPFGMLKFRTMVQDAEARQAELEHLNETGTPMFKMRDDPRITPLGRLLRKSSLDELPQLWNVVRGEMSLVGPRPLPNRDVQNFSTLTLRRRFSVKPGMTGLWQVNGRSDTVADAWIKYDLEYIDRWSLILDARILLKTLPAVLRGNGAV